MSEKRKICSVQCESYAQCAARTRVLVNYCGANNKGMGQKIHAAFTACAVQKNLLHKMSLQRRYFGSEAEAGEVRAA